MSDGHSGSGGSIRDGGTGNAENPLWEVLTRKNVLSGLLFMATAILALWISRDYSVGTTLRMGTGYVPRLLCWCLLGLGALVMAQGVWEAPIGQARRPANFSAVRPLVLVTGSLVVFALTLETLGLVISILLLVGIGSLATPALRVWETAVAAAVLILMSWAIFIVGLSLTIPVWPDL